MRTVLIERGIVTFNPGVVIQVEAPATAISTATASRPRAVTDSEPEFCEQLEQRRPRLWGRLRAFVDSVADLGVTPDFPASMAPAGRLRGRIVSGRLRGWLPRQGLRFDQDRSHPDGLMD